VLARGLPGIGITSRMVDWSLHIVRVVFGIPALGIVLGAIIAIRACAYAESQGESYPQNATAKQFGFHSHSSWGQL